MSGAPDEAGRARDAAFRLLAVRARTVTEMGNRLRRKDFEPAVVEEVIGWLLERSLLDDADFARQFLEDRLRSRPRGRFGLIRELTRRGVDRGVAEEALDTVMAERGIDEADIARDTARRWLTRQATDTIRTLTLGEPRDEAEKIRGRLYAHLERRGFRRRVALAVLDEVRDGGLARG